MERDITCLQHRSSLRLLRGNQNQSVVSKISFADAGGATNTSQESEVEMTECDTHSPIVALRCVTYWNRIKSACRKLSYRGGMVVVP